MQDSHPKPELTSVQHGLIGGLVGSIEQALMRPSVYWKAQMQQQRFTLSTALNPRYAYRGLPVAVMSIAPVTAVQFGAANACLNAIKSIKGAPGAAGGGAAASEIDRFLSSAFAGTASAMVQSPFQLVEVNQQNNGGSMAACARRVMATYGIQGLYRGASMTVIREGIFCTSFMALAPLIKGEILLRRPEMSDGAAVLLSSILGGGLGATLSHPADTLKTRLQGSLFAENKVSGPREALRELQQQGPLVPLVYRGYLPRVFRIVCCTYIYSNLSVLFEGLARDYVARASFCPLDVDVPCKPVQDRLGAVQ